MLLLAGTSRVADRGVLLWLWVVVETINGVGHSLWSIRTGGYTPGLATAPALLVLALYLAYQLVRGRHDVSAAA